MYIGDILDELDKYEGDKAIKVSDGKYLINAFVSDRGNYRDMFIIKLERRPRPMNFGRG